MTGKAYSATHDAISLARMSVDMAALGAAAGHAAALAALAAGAPGGAARAPGAAAKVAWRDPGTLRARLLAAGILWGGGRAARRRGRVRHAGSPPLGHRAAGRLLPVCHQPQRPVREGRDSRKRTAGRGPPRAVAGPPDALPGGHGGEVPLLPGRPAGPRAPAFIEAELRRAQGDLLDTGPWRHKMPDHGHTPPLAQLSAPRP